jgi:catechol 2,3-dioxygenase-like lactoylglutathione lyase family enzyme
MASTGRKSAAERDLRLLRLDHFNVPVRDLNVSRRFYCDVLGGVVVVEPNWERHNAGRALGAHLDFKVFDDPGCLIAFWQPWGQPGPDQVFPHRAFRVADAARLDDLRARLDGAHVPSVLVTAEPAEIGTQVPVSLFFRDPDGNQLEVRCERYPFSADVHVGTFDPSVQYYRWADWQASATPGGSTTLPVGSGARW